MTKTNKPSNLTEISNLLQVISPEPHLEILLAIGAGEACVCHLEARLGYRQAYISQQLMALREAGLLDSRRDGKYIYYHLARPGILELLQRTAQIAGVNLIKPELAGNDKQCACPHCASTISSPILVAHVH
jgi:DNA-binding transcriptional ArsR family regulator